MEDGASGAGTIGGWAVRIAEASNAAGPWGPALFALVYAAATVAMVPGSALTLGAGALFGPWVGTLTVAAGSNLGAACAFGIARTLGRRRVEAWAARDRRFAAVDRALGAGGWRVVALLRLSPLAPFNALNYALGLSPIRFWPCFAASAAAMLPGTALYVGLGHLGRAGFESAAGARARSPAEWGLLIAGLGATAAAAILLGRLARRELAEHSEGANAT